MSVLSVSQTSKGLPSPTLTNPDMILPDSTSSPSTGSSPPTPKQSPRLPSPPSKGNNEPARLGPVPGEKPRMKGAMYSPFENGVLRQHDGYVRIRSSSERGNNRIAFENNRLSFRQDPEVPIASSPTLHEDAGQRIFTESTQGDFEDGEGTYTTPAILEEDEDDPRSHAAMSRRAEAILANAKKRLTNMEGNLNRARSTLHARPSSSMSSFGNRSPEPVSLYKLPGKGRNPGGFSPSKHRQANLPILDEIHQGHSRVFSETSVPSSMHTGLQNGQPNDNDMSGSNGLGISGEDAALPDRHSEPGRNWFWNGLTRDASHRHANRHPNGLQALSEDGPAPSFEQETAQDDVNEEDQTGDLKALDAAANFNAQNPPSTGLTRARSTTQMNELREQMQDLKGKISNLKRRAREDNMRRRSFQSLRAPSPFTDAERWYTGTPSSEDIKQGGPSPRLLKEVESPGMMETPSKVVSHNPGNPSTATREFIEDSEDQIRDGEGQTNEGAYEATEDVEEIPKTDVNRFPSQKQRLVLVDEPHLADASHVGTESPLTEEPLSVDYEAREDSLYGDEDYHETSTSPVVERHEDRPDAFDYEHFILSSALGTYSGVGMRRSSSKKKKRANSSSSESSVETTKPRNSTDAVPQEDHMTNGGHVRKDSINSVSTDNTFATANEDADSDEEQDGWTFGHTRSGSRQAEPVRKLSRSNQSVPDGPILNGALASGGMKHIATAKKSHVNGNTRKSPEMQNESVAQPPDLLTMLATTGPWQEGAPPVKMNLGDRDRELVERLVRSLAKVCAEAQTLQPESSIYESRVFRRKLDAARRVLDGEMNGEAF